MGRQASQGKSVRLAKGKNGGRENDEAEKRKKKSGGNISSVQTRVFFGHM